LTAIESYLARRMAAWATDEGKSGRLHLFG
jgi:hypothetical protein